MLEDISIQDRVNELVSRLDNYVDESLASKKYRFKHYYVDVWKLTRATITDGHWDYKGGKRIAKRVPSLQSYSSDIQDYLKRLDVYSILSETFKSKFPSELGFEHLIFNYLSEYLYFRSLKTSTDTSFLTKRIIDEFEGKGLNNYIQFDVAGLDIVRELEIDFTDFRILMRRIKSSELEDYLLNGSVFTQIHYCPQSRITIQSEKLKGYELQRLAHQFQTTLRLYASCELVFYRQWISSDKFSQTRIGQGLSHVKPRAWQSVTIVNNRAKFRAFCEEVITCLSTEFSSDFSFQKGYLNIAYRAYEQSLEYRGSPSYRIAEAVIGLEALLVDGKNEINYTLKQRAGRLFEFVDAADLAVSTCKEAYAVRSSYVHGSDLPKKYNKDSALLKNLENDARSMLKCSLLLYLSSGLEKISLCLRLDDSMVKTKEASKLTKHFSSGGREIISHIRSTLKRH